MKSLISGLLFCMIMFSSCDTLRNTSNTTGNVFSLNGKWRLISNTPENTLLGSEVTVAPFVSEGRFTLLANNTQCYRESDIKWKDIVRNDAGGFDINNLLSTCTGGVLEYKPAVITVVNNNEIKITGKNIAGGDNTQQWQRVR